MSKNRLSVITYLGLLLLLGSLSTASSLMATAPLNKEYRTTVVELQGAYGNQERGTLLFSENEVMFEPSSGKQSEEWAYDHVRTIDVARSRLLKITLDSGKHVKFTSFGSDTFNSDLVQFLHNTVKAPVQVKSEL